MKHESYYSIIRVINNPFSEESLAIGLVVVSGNQTFIKFSQQKIAFAQKLNTKISSLLAFSLKQLNRQISADMTPENGIFVSLDKMFDFDYLERLCIYSNGILSFSKPTHISLKFSKEIFNNLFSKFIDIEIEEYIKPKESLLIQNVKEKFYRPLKDRIDINYTIKKGQLPSLFFDYHLDGIGLNGSMYSAKAVDINTKSIPQIKSDISEYESVIERLNNFANNKGLSDNKYYLIVDPYSGKSISYVDLYNILKQPMPLLKLISSSELDDVVNLIIDNNARKFSKEIEFTEN
jgi:hypothetical protein